MQKTNENKFLIASICLSNFFSSFNGSAINIAIPNIANDFQVQPQSITWVINAFIITVAPFLLGASALARRFSCYRIYALGVFLGSISSLLITISPNFISLVLFRALQGLIFSLVFCTSVALITAKVDKDARAAFLAAATSAVYAGLSLSPILAGILTDNLGWTSLFYLTFIGHITSFFLIKKVSKDLAVTSDLAISKIFLSFIAGALFLYSLSIINTDKYAYIYLIISILLIALYIFMENNAKVHLLDLHIFQNKTLNYALLASFFNYMSNFALTLLIAMHLELVQKLNATTTGLILIVQPIFMTIFSISTAKLTKKFGANNLCIAGMAIISVALYLLTTLKINSPLYIVYITQVIAGIGFGIFSAPNTNIVMSVVKKEFLASASALQALARNTGMAICMAIVTTILNSFIKVKDTNPLYVHELSESISLCFHISTFLCLIGLFFAIVTKLNYKV